VRVTDRADVSAVRRALDDAARSCPSIERAEVADYEPETDKYGGPNGMEVCERLFDVSSRLALACVERTTGRRDLRLVVGVWHFDALLAGHDMVPDLADAALADYARYWRSLTGVARPGEGQPGPSDRLIAMLSGQLNTSAAVPDIVEHLVGPELDGCLDDLRDGLAELRAVAQAGRLTTQLTFILWNLAHTMNNRLGIPPTNEALVADLLRGAYRARRSR
jgi:hypothetical protein